MSAGGVLSLNIPAQPESCQLVRQYPLGGGFGAGCKIRSEITTNKRVLVAKHFSILAWAVKAMCVYVLLQLELKEASQMLASRCLESRACDGVKAGTYQGMSAGRYLRLALKLVKQAV